MLLYMKYKIYLFIYRLYTKKNITIFIIYI